MSGFLTAVKENQKVLVDTNIVIYFLEDSPVFGRAARGLFQMVEAGKVQAGLSVVSVTELLVKPLKAGEEELVRKIKFFLEYFPNLRLYEVTREIAFKAAEVRAAGNIKVPDSILVATAFVHGCALAGNDSGLLKKNLGIRYICLSELMPEKG